MYEIMNPLSHPEDRRSAHMRTERDGRSLVTAVNAFNEMYRKGRLRRFWTKLTRRSSRLLDWNDYQFKVRNSIYRGLRIVPIDQIRGSEGRADDFDDQFHPLDWRMKDRWLGVGIAHHQGLSLPPVQLLLVCGVYFVRDGHHRISAARAFGQRLMDAEVTEVYVELPPPWALPSCLPVDAHLQKVC
jgi:hypothetical protein